IKVIFVLSRDNNNKNNCLLPFDNNPTKSQACRLVGGGGGLSALLLGDSDGTLAETVPEAALDLLQMTHATSSGGASADRLDGPLVHTLLRGGVSARSASVLLKVVGRFATTSAQSVRLIVALSKGLGSLGHGT
ncbi:hypothetical protein PENTCL1PPCAC_5837, partial [Pristionchus entomophagus]